MKAMKADGRVSRCRDTNYRWALLMYRIVTLSSCTDHVRMRVCLWEIERERWKRRKRRIVSQWNVSTLYI